MVSLCTSTMFVLEATRSFLDDTQPRVKEACIWCFATCCRSRITSVSLNPTLSLCVSLSVAWSGVPWHWVVGMEREGEFISAPMAIYVRRLEADDIYHLHLSLLVYCTPIRLHEMAQGDKVKTRALLNQKGMWCFPVGSPSAQWLPNGSDAFRRFIVFPDRGAGRGWRGW